jgi:hypothetical protein
MKRYRKRPVIVEAIQFDGSFVGADTIYRWANPPDKNGNIDYTRAPITMEHNTARSEDPKAYPDGWYLRIETLEGDVIARSGDWIIKGVNGEFYPCKDDIFHKTYEPVGDEPETFGEWCLRLGVDPEKVWNSMVDVDGEKLLYEEAKRQYPLSRPMGSRMVFGEQVRNMTEDVKESFMEKYGVEIDKKKVEDAKKKTPGEKTAGVNDPNVNVPIDPDKGTEPFEKKPEGE